MTYTHRINREALVKVCPSLSTWNAARLDELSKALGTAMHKFGITGQWGAAHFISQCAHETGEFKWLREIWGPSNDQQRYWNRADLQGPLPRWPWLGKHFRGGGVIQTTGRSNFKRAAKILGRKSAYKLAAESGTLKVAALLGAIWWRDHFPRDMSNHELYSVDRVSKTVNLGNPDSRFTPNGLTERRRYFERAKAQRQHLTPRSL